jgi:hypothetical protein
MGGAVRTGRPAIRRPGRERRRVLADLVMVPAQAFVAQHLATYKEFPPRQKPGSFSLDRVLEKLQEAGSVNR